MTVEKKYSVEAIRQSFDEVIKYAENFDNVHIDTKALFEKWENAKSRFIQMFGGKLIYEFPTPVCFSLSKDEKLKRLDEFINLVDNNNRRLADFIEDNKDGFYDNVVTNGERYNIPVGMKLLRAFKFFELNDELLKTYQTQASMLIQDTKVEGTLCFSVHPLDFISSSENTYNWRSCHALDGEYRAGNLSYMCDESTMMCYLRGANDAFLPSFPNTVKWNSKKWRMLLFFSKNFKLMFAGRQYPSFSENMLDEVKNRINHLDTPADRWGNHFGLWHNEQMNEAPRSFTSYVDNSLQLLEPYIFIGHELHKLKSLVVDGEHALNYNDLLYSSCYRPYWSLKGLYLEGDMEDYKIIVGAAVPCIMCGKDHACVTDSYLCEDCETSAGNSQSEEFSYCVWCDNKLFKPRSHWASNDEGYICPYCYENFSARCDTCGELAMRDSMIYDREREVNECSCCAEDSGRRRRNAVFRFPSYIWEDDLPF